MMPRIFRMKLDGIHPSQLFISSEKLAQVIKAFDSAKPELMEPIPVKKRGDQVIFVDGHTRALAGYLYGLTEISVYWEDDDELDWEAYDICVEWCKKEGIHSIADLRNRILPQRGYEILWLQRCEKMQQDLETRRKLQQSGPRSYDVFSE